MSIDFEKIEQIVGADMRAFFERLHNQNATLGIVPRTPSPFQIEFDSIKDRFTYPATNGTIPLSIPLPPDIHIFMQNKLGICLAEAVTGMLSNTYGKILNPRFTWNSIVPLNEQLNIPIQNGTTIAIAIEAALRGSCLLTTLPDDTLLDLQTYSTAPITPAMDAEAQQYRLLRGAYKLKPSFADITQAIAQYGAVVLVIDYCELLSSMWNGYSPVVTAANCGAVVDSHGIWAGGYTPQTILTVNSFSSAWGTNGTFEIDETFVQEHVQDLAIPLSLLPTA